MKKRSAIYLEAAENFEQRTGGVLYVCNEINRINNWSIHVSEITFPELFLFKELQAHAWLNAQYENSLGREVCDEDKNLLNIKTTVLLFCYEIAKAKRQ